MTARSTSADDDDPLTKAIAPPENESLAEREIRIQAEQAAKKRSDMIDDQINRERIAEKKAPRPVKILLLGQSESGKSTTLKNFQLLYSQKPFHAERASWRAVIQLNVVQSIRLIIDAMSDDQRSRSPESDVSSSSSPERKYTLSQEHLRLKMRLSPLGQVEESLIRKITVLGTTGADSPCLSSLTNLPARRHAKEISINSTAWKGAINRILLNSRGDVRESLDSQALIDFDDPDDPGIILHACAEDMIRLWNDPTIKTMLATKKLRLEEVAGFFLDGLERVTSPKYVPTDEDILRARIKTLGVSEYQFTMKNRSIRRDWRVFDVGGQRSLRAAWVPYFDDMNAIIFLAPISCFDQVLSEDATVNRLEDSVLLWRSVVSNPLLKNTSIVLFLNKCDILKAKLASGVRLSQFVVSYGKRPNDFDSVSVYLRKKFANIHKEHSPSTRVFYCHFTSVTDMKSTRLILANVQDTLIRQSLKESALLV